MPQDDGQDRAQERVSGEELAASAAALAEQVVGWRRHLHRHPELSFSEHETARYVREQLEGLPGIELTAPTETSAVAYLRRGRAGRVVALRADLDALPIEEDPETASPVRSEVAGVMHACGHDGHTAMLLGVAHLLAAGGFDWEGEVRLLFQHAEERPPGGARELVEAGVLDGAEALVGCHLWAYLETGRVGVVPGPLMAGSDEFTLVVEGAGGHGGVPHETVDPLAVGARIVAAIDQLVARQSNALEPLVVSVTRFHAGDANNVVPDRAELGGTIRTFDADVRARTIEGIERVATGIAAAHGATVSLEIHPGYAPLINDPETTALVEAVARRIVGDDAVVRVPPTMGSEDFSALAAAVPATYLLLGTRNEAVGACHPHHHPRFTIDEASLEQGVALLAGVALGLLRCAEPLWNPDVEFVGS